MKVTRRNFIKAAGVGITSTAFFMTQRTILGAAEAKRPNILWIIAEDMCPDIGCYGTKIVQTPNIDRLASEGVRFTNAFTTAPCCSPSRSAIMTDIYQTTIGAHNQRSHRNLEFYSRMIELSKSDKKAIQQDEYILPKEIKLITEYFRQAGYFTANVRTAADGVQGTCKTDFNFSTTYESFDGTDWNQRERGQPFFAQINFPEVHRPYKRAEENPVEKEKIVLPPYYPDHPVVREDWAKYYDTIASLDKKVGAVLKRLDDEGLAENTIVFFFADHGRAFIRGKVWLYDGGIHIPLIVRWPGKIKPDTVQDDLVSAIDIADTSLKIAGIEPPENTEGQPFLGPDTRKREYIIAARDRMDETVDRIRCVRTKRYKYIRNFYPERPYTQLNRCVLCVNPDLRIMMQLHSEGKLTPEQELFMAEKKPVEELYDLKTDPHEVQNLAFSSKHQDVLKKLRNILERWIKATGDKGAISEPPELVELHKRRMEKRYGKRLKEMYGEKLKAIYKKVGK